MSTTGFIFSNLNSNTLSLLTSDRTVAAIPFACRYRLVDFALSNMVNSDIIDINVIANYNFRSLVNHIGSGKDWDLARRSGGIKVLSPGQEARQADAMVYSYRLEALRSIRDRILELTSDTVVLTDSDHLYNIDLNDVIAFHKANDAEITFVTVQSKIGEQTRNPETAIQSDAKGRITDIVKSTGYDPDHPLRSIRLFVLSTDFLVRSLDEAVARNYHSFTDDIIMHSPERRRFFSYCFNDVVIPVTSFLEYYRANILLTKDAAQRNALLGKWERPIYTKVHNSPPTVYHDGCNVKDSLIADGCLIEGTVENSVLFRGVKVSRGAVVKNSILFGGTYVG
ncbi:MAG: glucose-1-phosphate adenylyltransferase subunit GlgD [Clostridia bacterium]|nr:glucose-1-phosphate adenylyltransferase subunit GlgD [Clostridia bacterium]